jgi:hypothetical protein
MAEPIVVTLGPHDWGTLDEGGTVEVRPSPGIVVKISYGERFIRLKHAALEAMNRDDVRAARYFTSRFHAHPSGDGPLDYVPQDWEQGGKHG